ncbi:hypothetical protein PGB90_010622 [Kerria lacca]
MPPSYNLLLPSTSAAAALTVSLSSSASSLSLDQVCSSSRSSTPFMFPPFPGLPVLPPSFFPGEPPMSLYTLLQQQTLIAQATAGYSSPNDLSRRSFIKCSICLAAFPNGWLLEQHTILQHSGQAIRRHNSSESGSSSSREEKPFQCDQCGQSYRYRSAYIKHREQNHRARLPADKLFTCDICGMQFRYLKSFKKHRVNHTLEMLQPIGGGLATHRKETKQQPAAQVDARNAEVGDQPSGVVSESQVSSSNEVEPQSLATSTPAKEESADSVAVSLTNPEPTLFNLLRCPPERRERQFACSFCSKTVRSKENLKLHVRKHTGERPFACLFCGRAFGGKSDLTRHVRIHTGERPYHCEMCGKCFARADYLSKHLTTHVHNSHSTRSTASSD